MLLLHGYGSKKESFYYQINYLKQFYKVTAVDFPAFGASEAPDTAWSVGDYALWLEKFILKAGLNRPHVIAHSFGARVAIKFCATRGGQIGRLIITGGAGLVKPRSKAYIRRVNAYRRIKKLFPKYAERHFGSEEYKKLSPAMKQSYKLIVNEDLKSCAEKIENRTLLIYGENDTTTPPREEGETFNRLIRGSRLEIMKNCTHFCFSEDAQTFNKSVSVFLSE